jgi:hypothetical protein
MDMLAAPEKNCVLAKLCLLAISETRSYLSL